MDSKRCAACRQTFKPRRQTPGQRYCSASACQRERRRLWQKAKLLNDPDYRDNQVRAQKAWTQRKPDYWREYRGAHSEYTEGNRQAQRRRNERRRGLEIAKMDASPSHNPLPAGIYRLSRAVPGIAKMDAWIVEIAFLFPAAAMPREYCKERT